MHRYVQKLEFYITNVCNLACPNCNRFNNHDFRGHQLWNDYERDYQQWANILKVSGLVILGGEPLLNPSICDWITGLNRCFANTVQVLTNGTRLNKTAGLYDCLTQYCDGMQTNWIGIHVHNTSDLQRQIVEVKKFLKGDICEYRRQLDNHACDPITRHHALFGADYTFVDENKVTVRIWVSNNFHNAAIHRSHPEQRHGQWQPGSLTVYDNDPDLAHENCSFAINKNYHMIRGRLHKCGPCVLLADFDRQHPLDISQQDRELMRSYRALSAWDEPDVMKAFFDNLDDAIPQCKFCPTRDQTRTETIFAVSKKSGSTSSFD